MTKIVRKLIKTKLKLASAQGGTKIKAVAQLKMKFLIVILSVVEESPKTINPFFIFLFIRY